MTIVVVTIDRPTAWLLLRTGTINLVQSLFILLVIAISISAPCLFHEDGDHGMVHA